MTTLDFIEKAKKVHGDKYNYSKVEYVNSHSKVCIICPKHGEFWQTPNNHLRGHKCPKCAGTKKSSTKEFIEKARKVHGDKYDYSKVEYISNKTKVCIICPKHGEFWQTPSHHLVVNECPKCAHQSFPDTKKSFIDKAIKVHGNKYDYSKVEYVNSHTKICIICPKHGEFWQTPTNHLKGNNCPKCKVENLSAKVLSNTEEFIGKAKQIHGNKYDYSKVNYKNSRTKVCIICPKHGEFWQTPNGHLRGHGCPKCRESHLETNIRTMLEEKNIKYEQNAHIKWLGRQHLDFYLPDYKIGIECQGEQHFIPSSPTSVRKKPLEKIIKEDYKKSNLCKENGVKLFYYTSESINKLAKNKPDFYNQNLYLDTEDIYKKIKDEE